MSPAPSRNDPASAAYLDLRRLARDSGRPTNELHQLYGLEGFLDRLAASTHNHHLVLKGGVLLAAFDSRRPTRDLDFAATDINGDAENLSAVVNDILAIDRDDGLTFDLSATTVESTRDNEVYPSTRAKVTGSLATARIRFHIDINIGDPLSPPPHTVDVPRLLGGPPISVTGYRIELVLAEKIVTAIQRGTANTRWRDFVDIANLAACPHDETVLGSSIAAVAAHRIVDIQPLSDALAGYAELAQPRWIAWRRKHGLTNTPEAFADLLDQVTTFTDPHLNAVRQER